MNCAMVMHWVAAYSLQFACLAEAKTDAWFTERGAELIKVRVSPCGKYFAAVAAVLKDNSEHLDILLVSTQSRKVIHRQRVHTVQLNFQRQLAEQLMKPRRATNVAWLPQAPPRLLYSTPLGRVGMITYDSGKITEELFWKGELIYDLVAAPNDKTLAILGRTKESEAIECILLDVASKKEFYRIATTTEEPPPRPRVCFADQGNSVILLDCEFLDVHNLVAKKCELSMNIMNTDRQLTASDVIELRDRQWIVTVSPEGVLAMWGTKNGNLVGTSWLGIDGLTYKLLVSQEAKCIICCSTGELVCFDLEKLRVRWRRPIKNYDCDLFADGNRLAVACLDGALRVLDVKKGAWLLATERHETPKQQQE